MDKSTRPILDQAFPLWLQLTGVSPDRFKQPDGDDEETDTLSLGEYDQIKASIAIHECFAIPDDDLTAQLMLSRYLDEYSQDISFTLSELLDGGGDIHDKIGLARQIKTILDSDQMVFQRADFAASLGAALAHYEADQREDVQALLEDDLTLAQLRRDAYYGIDELRLNQFLEGQVGEAVKPGYNTLIRRWWKMDDLLAAAAHLPEGVSLNLVCPGNEHELFFCFAIRRGANIYLLHDAPENEHPLQGQMSRSPGRRLEKRMSKSWFPYDTAGVRLADKGRKVRMEADGQALALPDQFRSSSTPLCRVADLPPEELVWTVMMFDRIVDRFWGPMALPRLPISYAAGQLRPDALALDQQAREAGLPVIASAAAQIAVPAIELEQAVSLDAPSEKLGEVGPLNDKAWLLDRYAGQVPDQALNLIAGGHEQALLTQDMALEINEGDRREVDFFKPDAFIDLKQMDPTHFGTPEELAADRLFIARSNMAKAISVLAKKEYEARRHEVREWLTNAYDQRKAFLMSLAGLAADDGLRIQDWSNNEGPEVFELSGKMLSIRQEGEQSSFRKNKSSAMSHELGCLLSIKDNDSYYSPGAFVPLLRAEGQTNASKPACLLTGASPTWFFYLQPTNAVELAWLLGMERRELPDVLQNYTSLTTPHGNSILDRCDPMLWALDDPWHELDKGIRIPLSKRGLAQLQKQAPAVDLAPLHGANVRLYRGEDTLPAGTPVQGKAAPNKPRR